MYKIITRKTILKDAIDNQDVGFFGTKPLRVLAAKENYVSSDNLKITRQA